MGIASAVINGADELVFTLTDTSTITAGVVGGAGGPVASLAVSVDCTSGDLIQSALDATAPQPVTVTASGTCFESLTIDRDGVRIVAHAGLGALLDSSGIAGPAVSASGAGGLEIFGMAILDDTESALDLQDSDVLLSDTTLTSGTAGGEDNILVFARSSSIRTENPNTLTLTPNTTGGFNVAMLLVDGSHLLLSGATVIETQGGFEARAILAINGSSVRSADGGTASVSDAGGGIPTEAQALRLETGSSALIDGGMTFIGPVVVIGSSIRLTEATLSQSVLAVVSGSSAIIDGDTGPCQNNNADCSVQIASGSPSSSAVIVRGASALEAEGMNAIGLTVVRDASVARIEGSFGTALVAGLFSTIDVSGINYDQVVCLTEQGRSQVTATGDNDLRNTTARVFLPGGVPADADTSCVNDADDGGAVVF